MRLQRDDFLRLSGDAADPDLHEAKTYLSQALESLRHHEDPIDALALLRTLRGTAYASRGKQEQALDAVGRWLEQRLQREPGVASARLRLELGWLRRMIMARRAEDRAAGGGEGAGRQAGRDGARGAGRGQRRPGGGGFGEDIDALRRRRARALQVTEARPEPVARKQRPDPVAPVAPATLPAVVAVFFADIEAVREARRKQKEREKKLQKKAKQAAKQQKDAQQAPPAGAVKDRLLALRPADAAIAPLVAELGCFLLATEGMTALFEATDASGGVPPRFYVCRDDIEERDGKRIATRVVLTPPEPAQAG